MQLITPCHYDTEGRLRDYRQPNPLYYLRIYKLYVDPVSSSLLTGFLLTCPNNLMVLGDELPSIVLRDISGPLGSLCPWLPSTSSYFSVASSSKSSLLININLLFWHSCPNMKGSSHLKHKFFFLYSST